MIAVNRQIGPSRRIVRDLRILEGEPVVAGTRVPVRCLVVASQLHGSQARVLEAYPRITRDDLREALRYYAAHRDLIDRYITENEGNEDEVGLPVRERLHEESQAPR